MAAEETQALVPVREETVDFYGDAIRAAQLADGAVYVPLRPLCDALGLSWAGQLQRTQRDEVLGDALSVCVIHTEAGPRPMQCLPLKHLPGWLFGVQATRVKPELRAKILQYRRECFDILWQAFAPPAAPAVVTGASSGAALALEIATAVQALARQQLDMEARLDQVGNKQEVMAGYMRGFVRTTQERLHTLERHLPAGGTISEGQAAELILAVKAVGSYLEDHGDRNGYQKVYSELYRRYGISVYRNLAAADYAGAMAWLKSWFDELQ